jgi:hypothetical protein
MATQRIWDGLDELLAEIAAMPESCAGEAAKLVDGAANGAYVDIGRAYPFKFGELRKGMRLKSVVKKGLVVGAEVQNVANIAWIFEKGSEVRHYFTVNGVKKLVGRMPASHLFGRRAARARRRLTQELKAMKALRLATVTGDA